MSDNELKPCPFCGGKANCIVGIHICDEYEAGTVICTDCGDEVPTVQYGYGVSEPYREWNRRSKAKCSECGYGLYDGEWLYCSKCGARMVDE